MALVTAIIDEKTIADIQQIYRDETIVFKIKLNRIKEIFLKYLVQQDQIYIQMPITTDLNSDYINQYENQYDMKRKLEILCQPSSELKDDLNKTFGNLYQEGNSWEKVTAYAETYDDRKKFSFVKVEDMNISVFFHAKQIYERQINLVVEGDIFVCDISRSEKGFQVDKIYTIDIGENLEKAHCKVVNLYSDRNYGFARIEASAQNDFFAISIFPKELQ